MNRLRGEQASIPVTILVSIVVAGMLIVMFSNARQSQRTVAFDRDFAGAIQIADAGVQAAFTYIVSQDESTWPAVGASVRSSDLPASPATAAVGDGDFSWEAHRTGPRTWQVRAEGEYGGVTRYLESEWGPRDLFTTAMYGHTGLSGNYPANAPGGNTPGWHGTSGLVGGIGAYDSRTNTMASSAVEIIAGTSDAGDCNFNPAPDELEEILYGDGDIGNCDEKREPIPLFPDLASQAFNAPDGVCNASLRPADGDADSLVNLPDGITDRKWSYDPSDGGFQRNTVYCLRGDDRDLVFPSSHVATLSSGTGHVEVYVEGRLIVQGNGQSSRKYINVPGPGVAPAPKPEAAALRLFFADTGEAINITNNNHVWFAAAIYAPLRTCEFGTQTIFYGAANCNQIRLPGGGGFRFFYDVATADIFADQVTILSNWREEGPGTTDFDWVTPAS